MIMGNGGDDPGETPHLLLAAGIPPDGRDSHRRPVSETLVGLRILLVQPARKPEPPAGIGIFRGDRLHRANDLPRQRLFIRSAGIYERIGNGERHQRIICKGAVRMKQLERLAAAVVKFKPTADDIPKHCTEHISFTTNASLISRPRP